jgi:hypothetical protein
MPSTLAQFRTRIAQALVDTGNTNYATGALDEALRTALDEYTQAAPLGSESLVTLPGVGRTIALNELTGLLNVIQIWWPYDSLLDDDENEAANQVKGFALRFDDARPIVQLKTKNNSQPQTDDETLVWWTAPHTIQDLSSASITTMPAPHESGLVAGAAAYAAIARAIDRADEFNLDLKNPLNLASWGERQLARFNQWLALLRAQGARSGTESFGPGWPTDTWDHQEPTW